MSTRVQRFLNLLNESGGDYRLLWATKRNLTDAFDNVFCYSVFGERKANGGHPYAGNVILIERDGGLEVFNESGNVCLADDIRDILDRAAG